MESLRSRALSSLLAARNPDGGWGYRDGGSWTEPTALALLASGADPSLAALEDPATRYLTGLQRPDGGWPPRPSVAQSTWVTAVAVLALGDRLPPSALGKAVQWLLRQSGEESTFVRRLRLRLLGLEDSHSQGEGWPWFPETAAWTSPTALTILALEKAKTRIAVAGLEERLRSGRQFLWSRVCRDGGWNHGSTRTLGYEAGSYPETTGLALLALHGQVGSKLPAALAAAERHLSSCRSSSGVSWLRLGLLAHARPAAGMHASDLAWRGVPDIALWLLADQAATGKNAFLV